MIEILSNYFRSVVVLSTSDLLASVYLSLNQLAPAYEGVELGIAEHSLLKAIAQSMGCSLMQIKTDAQNTGGLGLVAEQSMSSQRINVPSGATHGRRHVWEVTGDCKNDGDSFDGEEDDQCLWPVDIRKHGSLSGH